MLKRIPKSDISIRPFKAYKNWNFDQHSAEISVLQANISSSELSGLYPKKSIYGQLRAQFYNGNEFDPISNVDTIKNVYDTSSVGRDRYLGENAKVISIPQIYVGEGIKKGSVHLIDGNSVYADDSYGNLIDTSGDTIKIQNIDLNTNFITFVDIASASYTATIQNGIGNFNIQSGSFNLRYNNQDYNGMNMISFDINSGLMVVDNVPFLEGAGAVSKIGNVFYSNGLITVTKYSENHLSASWNLSYKSTETIYEHEYLLVVNKDEFNVSTNPSAVVEVGKVVNTMIGTDGKTYNVTTNPGVKYIRKASITENGNRLDFTYSSSYNPAISGGFGDWEQKSSMDSTGSFLAPFITTIGLYDDDMDLVAVAKLPQPIKSEPDIPVNFIIRFDT